MSDIENKDNAQVEPQVETQSNDSDSGVDLNLIAESKKYRKRAQESEAINQELQKKLSDFEENRLQEQDKYKELSEKRKAEIEMMKPDYERLKAKEEARRESMIAKFPEEERPSVENLPIDTLEYVYNKTITKSNEPLSVPSTDNTTPKTLNPENKAWTDMSAKERRDNWGAVLDSYKS